MRLRVEELAARRGERVIFSNVSLGLEPGEATVVTGPNGAGKTTLLRVLAGLLPASGGSFGFDPHSEDEPPPVHYLGHHNALKFALTAHENLDFWQSFAGAGTLPVADALERVGLTGVDHVPAGDLSAGQKRRVALARLLLNDRPVWLLDEPTSTLDQDAEARFVGLIEDHLETGGIAVITTHRKLALKGLQTLKMGGVAR